MKRYKKVDYFELKEEEFEMKPFFREMNLTEARTLFGVKTNTLRGIKYNFLSDPHYSKQLYVCDECSKMSTTNHLLYCEGYTKLKVGLNIHSNDLDLVQFIQKILEKRDNSQAKLKDD